MGPATHKEGGPGGGRGARTNPMGTNIETHTHTQTNKEKTQQKKTLTFCIDGALKQVPAPDRKCSGKVSVIRGVCQPHIALNKGGIRQVTKHKWEDMGPTTSCLRETTKKEKPVHRRPKKKGEQGVTANWEAPGQRFLHASCFASWNASAGCAARVQRRDRSQPPAPLAAGFIAAWRARLGRRRG